MTTATTALVGTTLGQGRYQVKRKLGEGGMALVFLAHDQNVGVDVVIKVPKPIMLAEPEFARRFKHEIRSMVQLAHPHVVKVKDVGEHEGLPYYVMEHLTGGSLEDRLGPQVAGTRIPMAPANLATWLETVAAALDFIHGQGVVHRDIKPANILFDGHGNAYVSDFGIAKAVAGESAKKPQTVMTQAGMILGTGPYLAPEVSLGESYDGRADQYALAATVYEVLGGRVPFAGTTIHAIIIQQTSGKIPPLSELVPSLPKALCQVVERGLHHEAKKRYANCAAFAKAVLAAVNGVPSAGSKPVAAAAPALKMTCPSCKTSFRLPANPEGSNVTCPACKKKYAVAKRPLENPASETSQSIAPGEQTRAERREQATPSSKQMRTYLLAGFGISTLALSCAGLLAYWGAGMLGFTSKKVEPAVAQPTPVQIASAKKDEPVQAPPLPVEKVIVPEPTMPPPKQPAPDPIPPAKAPLPDLGTGVFLMQSMVRVTDWAEKSNKGNVYGYDNGVSIMSAWVNKGKSPTFRNQLVANTDYKFVAAGDNDAQIIELELFDDVTKQRVAQDQTGRPEAIVTFRPSVTRNYTLKLTLVQSRDNLPCMCSLVWLKRSGWAVPFSNLGDVTFSISKRVADLGKTQSGNKKYEYTRVLNQWAVYGGVLNPGLDLSVDNVNLGTGDRVLIAACDKFSNRLDLTLLKAKAVFTYQGPPTNEPSIAQRAFLGTGHVLRVRNSSTLPGPSLVMMAVVDVTK